MTDTIKNRYEFILLFDVENGNPNGDPDAGNMPRIDPETSLGLVTDVCLKRKVRNYIKTTRSGTKGFNIYVEEGAILNNQHLEAYKELDLKPEPKKLPKDQEKARELTRFMCKNFFDIRSFGAVMSTDVNCGVVRGPIQFTFARSVDPIVQQEITITRMAVTSVKDAEKKDREMGRKHIVPYGLYRAEGFISACLAEKTEFTEADLEVFWEALINLFEHDRSAARGKMSTQALIVFQHESKLGNAPANRLFDAVTVTRKDFSRPPRSFSGYDVSINEKAIPDGVNVILKV